MGDSIATSNAQKRAVKKYQEKMKRVPLDMPKDTYEWVKTCAEYVGETVNGFIKRAAYERAALECDPSPEGAAKKLEEKRAERKAYLDSLEQTVVDGKTVYSSGKTEVGGETGSGVLKK